MVRGSSRAQGEERELLSQVYQAVREDVNPRQQPERVVEHAKLALKVARAYAGRIHELQWASEDAGFFVDDWLMNLPFSLGISGHVDQAVELSTALAELDPINRAVYLADLAVVLAEAGRDQQTRAQIDANLTAFPMEVWVRIHAGDALRSLGDLAGAEAHFRAAADLAEEEGERSDHADALERLADFLDGDVGRAEEAREARKASDALRGELASEQGPTAATGGPSLPPVEDRSGVRGRPAKTKSRAKRKAARASRRRNRS